MERHLCVCKLSISALQGSIKSLLGLSDLFDTVESGKCCRCLALVNLKSQVWHVILSYRSSACCNNMSKHCTYIFTSEGNNVIGLIKITVLRFTNEHLISSNSSRLSVYSYHLSTLKCVGHPRNRQVRSTLIIGDNRLTEGAEGRRRGEGVSRKNKRSNNSVKKKVWERKESTGFTKETS